MTGGPMAIVLNPGSRPLRRRIKELRRNMEG
jgi:hypothetical protein